MNITSAPTEPIILECELSRKPRESVKWLKNGKALPPRLPSHITIDEKSGSTVHSVSFTKITEEDLGEYTIQVENISSTGKLDMQGTLKSKYTVLYASQQNYMISFWHNSSRSDPSLI